MTFFHFLNCIGLSCAPHLITYKYSGLTEYGTFWKILNAGAFYLLIQFCKMLALATFFPAPENSTEFDVIAEFLRVSTDVADLLGLHFFMSKIVGRGDLKFMIAGLGWASAELIMTRAIPFWSGARGIEFDWKYIQMALDSNIGLGHHLATAVLVWLYSRNDLKKAYVPFVFTLLLLCVYKPFIVDAAAFVFMMTPWSALMARAVYSAIIGLCSVQLYNSLMVSANSFH